MTHLPLIAPLLLLAASEPPPLQLKDDDCVVSIGSAMIEREQRYGYWEAALTARFPGKKIRFRNLGWSGDTVFGDARAGFGTAADGFRQLKEHVLALKPTVILVGYGTNESFDGPGGLARFSDGLAALLEAVRPSKARIILLSPMKQEDLGRPLPDPQSANRNLRLYADAIRATAEKQRLTFVDLFDLPADVAKGPARLTDDEVHLTAYGYWRTAPVLLRGLGLAERAWSVEVDANPRVAGSDAVKARALASRNPKFVTTEASLPLPSPVAGAAGVKRTLKIRGLPSGSYSLRATGSGIGASGVDVHTARAKEWAAGIDLQCGPEFDQGEKLRAAIIAKNRLYFYRWRPENETYLFGFRKHEQGQNAREIPQFDPLIAAAETEIAKLSVPARCTYQLRPTTPN